MRRLEIVSVDPNLSSLAKCVALRLFIRTNRASGRAFPSQALLARELNVSERSIRYALKELVKNGHVVVDHYRGRGCANLYELVAAASWQKEQAEKRLDADPKNGNELPTKRKKKRKPIAEVVVENTETGCRASNRHPENTLPLNPGNVLPTNPLKEPLVDEWTDLYSIPGLLN